MSFNLYIMEVRPVNLQYKNNVQVYRAIDCSSVNKIQSHNYVASFGQKFPAVNYSKLDNLTYQKYKSLSFFDKLKVKFITPLSIKRDAQATYYAARCAKGYLDEHFGRDDYTLMIIGRSLASVGETIGYIGGDVKLLPMSGLSYGLPESIEHVDVYKKFLNSIGLNKKFIEENPDRHFILLDYVSSGGTLKNAHKFLSRPDLLGNFDRLEILPANLLFRNNRFLGVGLELLCLFSKLKKYSPVSSLNLSELDKTFERVLPEPKYKDKRNLFLFHIMRKVEHYRKKTGKE